MRRQGHWIAVVVVVLFPGVLNAQEVVQHWPGRATPGLSTAYVIDDAGRESAGTLLRLDTDSLVLLEGGVERRFQVADVRRIEKRGDSLRNGALIGAVVGIVVGVVAAGIADCPGDDPDGRCPGFRVAAALISTGTYAAIGTGIDALVVGRTTLYEAPVAPRAYAPGESALPRYRARAAYLHFRW